MPISSRAHRRLATQWLPRRLRQLCGRPHGHHRARHEQRRRVQRRDATPRRSVAPTGRTSSRRSAAAPAGLTVVGANDIESTDFSGTEAQAVQWEQAYLAVDNTAGAVGNLIFNGSADGCPSSLGVTHRTCANGWTQADYYQLTHALNASRIQALPQVYNSAQPRSGPTSTRPAAGRSLRRLAHRVRCLPDRHGAGLQRADLGDADAGLAGAVQGASRPWWPTRAFPRRPTCVRTQ